MKTAKQSEKSIHKQVATYLKLQYPKIIFRTDFAAGCKMSIGQAVAHKALQAGPGYPDLFIACPKSGYHGMFIELKKDISEVWQKNLQIVRKNDHINMQVAMLAALNKLGYLAVFGFGFDHAKKIIDEYLN